MKIVSAREIECENVIDLPLPEIGTVVTCDLSAKTSIETKTEKTVISTYRGKSIITGLKFKDNKKIVYLPVEVDEKYPGLIGYDASKCSIKEISKENFKGLSKLKILWLHHNFIERVDSDTFQDLSSLQVLVLGKKS
jgi:Leucine rich repeat